MATFTSIAENLLAHAKELDAYVASKGLSLDTLDHATLTTLPAELKKSRDGLINGGAKIRRLAEGPEVALQTIGLNWTDILSLRGVYHYKLTKAVPLEGTASYAEISAASGLAQPLVFRFIRHAIINGIFDEPEPGRVSHTAMSRLLATNPDFTDLMGWCVEELSPIAASYIDAINKWGNSPEPTETAFSLLNDSKLPLFVELSKTPERARRFGGAMRSLTTHDHLNVRHILNGFDWAGFDKEGTVAVDVGGGLGHISRYLASNTKNIKFIVQDLPHVIEQAKKAESPAEIEGRVEYVGQDFFKPQSIEPAEIFFLRGIIHNWSDKYVLQMIKNLVPVLKKGSRVLLFEFTLEVEPVKEVSERMGWDLDLMMGIGWNGKERSSADVQALFKEVDERFVWVADHRSTSNSIASIEMSFEPQESKL